MKVSAGNSKLDEFLLGGYEKGVVTTIYGPGGAGKTLLLILAMASAPKDKKIIFIDTEGGFSPERLAQVTPDHKEIMERTIFLKPTNFEEQDNAIKELKNLMSSEISMICMDTLTALYRIEMTSEDNYGLNKELAKQLRDLVGIARKKEIPVIVTGQVYSSVDKDQINVIGGAIVRNMSKCLLEIEKNDKRKLVVKKHRSLPEDKEIEFKIIEKGIE